jgi:hypothetical protein
MHLENDVAKQVLRKAHRSSDIDETKRWMK